jgi:hypothetical protein
LLKSKNSHVFKEESFFLEKRIGRSRKEGVLSESIVILSLAQDLSQTSSPSRPEERSLGYVNSRDLSSGRDDGSFKNNLLLLILKKGRLAFANRPFFNCGLLVCYKGLVT